jgi:ElaB/YqjD/DUF883 family membrane-anchored ribosome-binding protein
VKRALDERRREGESYNDVLERILDEDRDILSGAGFWSDEEAEQVRQQRQENKKKSKERMKRLAEGSNEGT